jgi:hypothetical protein
MNLRKLSRKAVLFASLVFCGVGFADGSAGERLLKGEKIEIFGGDAESYAVVNEQGHLRKLGISISMQTLTNATTEQMASFKLNIPDLAGLGNFINHVSIDWNPMGHPPMNVYTIPHFDLHFYGISMAKVAAIDCQRPYVVDPALVPEGYMLPDPEAPDACVPQMGVHALPATDLVDGFEFWETMIYGYNDNAMIFIEPMIAQRFFLEKRSIEKELIYTESQLAALGQDAVPQHYAVTYDETTDRYIIEFADFFTGQ